MGRPLHLNLLCLASLISSLVFAKGGGSSGGGGGGTVHVGGYTRSNGTYVAPSTRTAPNATKADNWSTKGNINPYTGKARTKVDSAGSLRAAATATEYHATEYRVPAYQPSSGAREEGPVQIGGPTQTNADSAAKNFKAIAKGMKPDQVVALLGQPNIKTSAAWMYSGQGWVRFVNGVVSAAAPFPH